MSEPSLTNQEKQRILDALQAFVLRVAEGGISVSGKETEILPAIIKILLPW